MSSTVLEWIKRLGFRYNKPMERIKNDTWKEGLFLLFLVFITTIPRFSNLGFSDFYGDETKTLYWDKTVPAKEFLLNQRKGPVQFLIAWFTQELTSRLGITLSTSAGSAAFNEFWLRLPFAIAGTLAVFAFYVFVRRLYDWRIAAVASVLFSLTGFYVAFSRTVQYQSFLLLFGFLAAALFVHALPLEGTPQKPERPLLRLPRRFRLALYSLSGIFLALALLTHWDAVFFAIPIGYFIVLNFNQINKRELFLYFALPLTLLTVTFYLPYISGGLFTDQTVGYISRRMVDGDYVPNYSPYTISVYSPFLLFFMPLIFSPVPLFTSTSPRTTKNNAFYLWFMFAFAVFQFIFSNPGTHIHLYLIPLFVLSAVGFVHILELLSSAFFRRLLIYPLVVLLFAVFILNFFVYVPTFHLGYPWKAVNFGFLRLSPADKTKHLFLYGFPYNRRWREVRDFLHSLDGVRNVYTNDNATVAEHYLRKYDVIAPGSNFLPQYYVEVMHSHEFKSPGYDFLSNYDLVRVFKDEYGFPVTRVYKLRD